MPPAATSSLDVTNKNEKMFNQIKSIRYYGGVVTGMPLIPGTVSGVDRWHYGGGVKNVSAYI